MFSSAAGAEPTPLPSTLPHTPSQAHGAFLSGTNCHQLHTHTDTEPWKPPVSSLPKVKHKSFDECPQTSGCWGHPEGHRASPGRSWLPSPHRQRPQLSLWTKAGSCPDRQGPALGLLPSCLTCSWLNGDLGPASHSLPLVTLHSPQDTKFCLPLRPPRHRYRREAQAPQPRRAESRVASVTV